MPDWTIERLASHHQRADFDCGKPLLSDWIKQQSSQFEKRDLARTYVAVRPGQSRVQGYYAISSCQVRFEDLPSTHTKGLPRRLAIPATLIARLAVDKPLQGQSLGKILLVDALRRIQTLADQIGIRAITVDAIDDQARDFYLKKGFEPLLDNPRHLFMPIQVARGLGLPPLSG